MSKRVALFFDDAELGGHLRAALLEHGAQIAHEGPVDSFDVARLRQDHVEVLVVNLDESVDDAALDLVYELAGSGDTNVVFNDAQASRGLDGWDRARWARHLAAKALGQDSIDPPRPVHAPVVVEAHPVPVEEVAPAPQLAAAEPLLATTEPEPSHTEEDSETLAAELEALLASDETPHSVESEFGTLKFNAEDELPPLHEGDFGQHEAVAPVPHEDIPTAAGFAPAATPAAEASPAEAPAFHLNLDHLSLAALDEEFTPPVLEKATLAQQTPGPIAPEWGFVEEDEHVAASVAGEKPSFSVEKVSAADYLAPDAELHEEDSPLQPGMSLELVSMEEAIAPPEQYQPFESDLRELDAAFARLLVLGAARDSSASLAAFLAALPGDLKLPILLAQHHGDGAAEQLVASLSAQCNLPVRLATAGMRTRAGEVLVVPHDQQVRISRDGRVELSAAPDTAGHAPSIDSSFTMAANAFGRGALAIVFAGQANDAVAGAQAIHDRGGQVWVEAASGDHYTDMVHGVMAERLANFSGSPQELAARLMDDFR